MKRNNFSKMVLTLFASLALVITGTSTVNNKTQQVVKAEETGTVKYTVATVTSVTSTGAVEGSTATFKSTYSTTSQLTKGNSATLTVTGLDGYIIKGIVLSMKSNGKSGSGTFSAKVGNETLAEISSSTTFSNWFDNKAYSTSYKDVTAEMKNSNYTIGTGETLTIVIAATANSLYIQSYTLSYEKQSTPENIGQTFERASTKSQLKLAYSQINKESTSTELSGYTKVTSELEDYSGKYLLVYEKENDAYIFNGEDVANGYVAATINNNFIEATETITNVEVSIDKMEGGYSINTSNGYMYGKSGKNTILFDTKNQQLNTISIDENGKLEISSFTSYFRFNSDSNQMRFRYFQTTNQAEISLYKATYSNIVKTYDIESTSLRFGTTISKDLYDGLVAEGTNVTFGVISQATSVLGENELTVENAGNTKELTPVRVDTELASEESETGNYYQFAVLFTGLTAADYTTEVTARCYVCIDGTYYYMQAKTCSVKSIAADYLSLQADNEQVVANSGVLNYLANYTAE